LAGAPASLVAGGSAHLRSLHDMLFDASARRIDGDGEYELHLHFDEKRMNASLSCMKAGERSPGEYPLLARLGALQAEVNLNGPRSAEQLEVSLLAGELREMPRASLI